MICLNLVQESGNLNTTSSHLKAQVP